VARVALSVSLGFSDLALVKARLQSCAGLVMDEETFHEKGARLSFRVPAEKADEIGRMIVDLTSGRAEIGD
jgi:putative IMPACT (imprinted ancient) family translation regulator